MQLAEQCAKQLTHMQPLLPSFISHPNGIILRVLNHQQSILSPLSMEMDKQCAKQCSLPCLPSFISHPNGTVLRVFNQKQKLFASTKKKEHLIESLSSLKGLIESVSKVLDTYNLSERTKLLDTLSLLAMKIEIDNLCAK